MRGPKADSRRHRLPARGSICEAFWQALPRQGAPLLVSQDSDDDAR